MSTPAFQSESVFDAMMEAALEAGRLIMEVYESDFDATLKGDGSPVTIADQQAEDVIIARLKHTGIPLLGEESVAAGVRPELGERFFVVDPLDGTKEFIKRNGEFTVNIALVEHGVPVAGIVLAPALHLGFAGSASGAFEYEMKNGALGAAKPIRVAQSGPMRVVASRSHGHAALRPLCDTFEVTDDVSVGSSLKFCLVANGTARFYPRFTPTCEWDTAAGQAVLQAAGGAVVQLDGVPLAYGKTDKDFYNPFFVAADSLDHARRVALRMREILETQSH